MQNSEFDLGGLIKTERIRLKLTQKEFADLGGISLRSQIAYEKGENKPNSDYFYLLACNNVDVCSFFSFGEKTNNAHNSLNLHKLAENNEVLANQYISTFKSMMNVVRETGEGIQDYQNERGIDEELMNLMLKFKEAPPEIQTAIKALLKVE